MKLRNRATDYTPDMLPQNRKEVFFDVVKLHFWDLIKLGFLLLLFAMPLHLLAIGEDILTGSIYAQVQNATQEQQQGAYLTVLGLQVLRGLISTALVPVFTVGLAGVLRVIRQYSWGENVFFGADFPKGIRQNWKMLTRLQFLLGVVYTVSLLAQQLSTVSTGVMMWLLQLPMAVFILMILPVAGYAAGGIPVYTTGLSNQLLTSLKMYIKTPFYTLLAMLCAVAIYLPLLIPNLYVHIFGRAICSLLTPFVLLGWSLFCYHQQDRYINQTAYPELLGRGILSKEGTES